MSPLSLTARTVSIGAFALVLLSWIVIWGLRLHDHGARVTPLPPPARTLELLRDISSGNRPVLVSPTLLSQRSAWNLTATLTPEEAASALSGNSSFWDVRREKGFSAALLGASQSDLPVVRMLLESPLWVLVDISPWGFLFREKGPLALPWDPHAIAKASPDEPRWIPLIAENLIAAGEPVAARSLLETLPPDASEKGPVLEARASLAAAARRWCEGAELARKALRRADSPAARRILIRCLTEEGNAAEAETEAEGLVARECDAESLFLLARAANAAGDRQTEIRALNRLVDYGRKHGQPISASLTYLGQALARNGERGPAMRALEEAASDPSLTPKQKEALREMSEHIRPESMEEASRSNRADQLISPSNGQPPGG